MKILKIIAVLWLSFYVAFSSGRWSYLWLSNSEYRRIYERSRVEKIHLMAKVAELKDGESKKIKLADVTKTSWDEVCFFSVYNNAAKVFQDSHKNYYSELKYFTTGEGELGIILMKKSQPLAVIILPFDLVTPSRITYDYGVGCTSNTASLITITKEK